MPKRFTLAQAERLLPEIATSLREAISLKAEYEETESCLSDLSQRVAMMGGMLVDREAFLENRARHERVAAKLKAALEHIQEFGCVVKDLDIGLVDFPTLFRGEEVYLCWKLGEANIEFWHGVKEGFAGRKKIDQDFLDNHLGDLPN